MAKRKRRPAPSDDDNPVIGYVAALTARSVWCAGETAIVASSERQLRAYLGVSVSVFRMAMVRFDTLVFGLRGALGMRWMRRRISGFIRWCTRPD